LTFSPLGGPSLKITGGNKPIVVFPTKIYSDTINLLAAPEEQPPKEAISWPGEYDIAGITVRGVGQLEGQKVSYLVEADGVRCAFPASPLEEWSEYDIERLGDVHVLVLPGENLKACQQLIDEIDPRILILVPAKDGTIHPDVLKHCGAQDKEAVSEFKLKGALPAEGREVVVFKA
jgi:hypothetical protein